MLDSRQLHVFLTVVTSGSYSAAARELGYTQPAISQQMRALERRVGTVLFIRIGRRMRLTEAGEVLARNATQILAGLHAAEEQVAAVAGLRAGQVRLAAFPSASATLVPRAVATLTQRNPGLRVSLVDAEPPQSLPLLRDGECDVVLAFSYADSDAAPSGLPQGSLELSDDQTTPGCVVVSRRTNPSATPSSALPDRRLDRRTTRKESLRQATSGLLEYPLLDDPLHLFLPTSHHAARRRSIKIVELAAERWIAGCPVCRTHFLHVCAAAGFEPDIVCATDDNLAVQSLVAAGVGVALMPNLVVSVTRHPGIVSRPAFPKVHRRVAAYTLPGLQKVPAVTAVLRSLEDAARESQRTPENAL